MAIIPKTGRAGKSFKNYEDKCDMTAQPRELPHERPGADYYQKPTAKRGRRSSGRSARR